MKKHFYIFRHGQTVWNAEGRPQGQHEYPVPLTMEGREQAQKLADKLKDKKIKLKQAFIPKTLASPQKKTVE